MIHPDRETYAASVPKIGILLAYFELHPEAADASSTRPSARARRDDQDLQQRDGREVFARAGPAATSRRVLDEYGFYDKDHGGGIWVGKHYGKDDERYRRAPSATTPTPRPCGSCCGFTCCWSRASSCRRRRRRRCARSSSRRTSRTSDNKFVKGLDGREACRSSASRARGRTGCTTPPSSPARAALHPRGLTEHPKGDEYLVDLARAVDEVMSKPN